MAPPEIANEPETDLSAQAGDAAISKAIKEPSKKKREKVIRVDQIWDKKTRKYHYAKTAKATPKDQKFSRYVLTVARRISTKGVFTGEYIVDFRANFLCEVLDDIYKDVEGVNFPPKASISGDEVKLLYHAFEPLKKRLGEVQIAEPRIEDHVFELEAVVEFIAEHYGQAMSDLKALPANHITFEHLWTMYPHNSLAYGVNALGEHQVYRVRGCLYRKLEDESLVFDVNYDYIDYNGRITGFVPTFPRTLKSFEGSVPITSLSMFPFRAHPEYDSLRKEIILRGEKMMELTLRGRVLQEYDGHAVVEKELRDPWAYNSRSEDPEPPVQVLDENHQKFNTRGRVMVDPAAFERLRPSNELIPMIEIPIREEDLTDTYKLLLSAQVYGFSFGDKIWGSFAVSQLGKVTWDDTIIEALVIPEERKTFVKMLVKSHGSRNGNNFDDVVRDKGKGLIGLLAGPPGVGKTLTAEAVAEIARRPLYMLSSGELGDDAREIQLRLDRVLELTATWGAVLLLDEADIFLVKRDDVNLSRNAITSIFLRKLEYHRGILILTTNRSLSFDEAFASRIQFRFDFEELTVEAREEIWTNFLRKAKNTCAQPVQISAQDTKQLAQILLNGRQIKNIISMAQAVATEGKTPMDLDGINRAIKFSGYASEAKA